MVYRTKTYIAAEWTGEEKAVKKLYEWEKNKFLSLSFSDAHELTQSRDSSLNCTIKKSLKERLDASKIFVLIVGDKTKTVTSGSCQYCDSYDVDKGICKRYYSLDFDSYIKFECNKAVDFINDDKIKNFKIVVLYNAAKVDKTKCPDVIKNHGTHIAMEIIEDGVRKWNYQSIKNALNS